MPDKTFKVGNEIYDIPEKDVSAFMKDFSDAIEVQSFIVDKDTFDIPINDVQEFMKDYPNAKPLKKKGFPTVSEESLVQESTSTSQQNLLNSERTPYFTVENIDDGVDSRLKSETERYAQTLKESPKPVRSQMTWKAQERSKVREYNSTLSDISESIQQNDVQHYLNVVKSPMLKTLTEKTDEIKEEKMADAVKYKVKKAEKLRNELKASNIVDSDELTWIDNNPLNIIDEYLPDSDLGEGVVGEGLKTAKTAYKRWTQFGTAAVNNSLWGLGFLAMGETGKDLLALGHDIQANYDPSKLEEYASIGIGFAFDTPIFMALGGVGGAGAKAFTKVALRTTTKELMQLGLTGEVAQGIALKSLSGSTQLAIKGTAGAIGGSTVLSTYNAVNDAVSQYKEAYASGEDLEHYDWRRTLESWSEGLLIGTATGFVSPMFSSAGEVLSNGLKSQAAKKAASRAVSGLDLATESTLFAAIPAALDDRAITQDDIVESGLMLLAIKGGNLPMNMVGRINVSKTKGKPIEYTDREKELLGITTDPYDHIKNISLEDLKKIESDRNISTLTKLKIMENHLGIAPRGEISIDAIRVEQEGDRTFLRTYRKEKEGSKYEYELLSENEYADKTLADAEAKKGLEMLYDMEIRKAMQDLPVRQQGLATIRLVEVLGADSKKLKDVLDIPVFARNEEQRAIAQKFYEVANEITGLGKNAYESKMLDDSFGTEKLHLKEREISPKKEEAVSEIEAKKADIERRRHEEMLNRKGNTISQSEVLKRFIEKRDSDKIQEKLIEGLYYTNGSINPEKRWIDKDDTIFDELTALGVKPDSRGVIDNTTINKAFTENESRLRKEVNEEIKQEGLKRVTDEFRKQDDLQKFKEINAKYDAELAKLEQSKGQAVLTGEKVDEMPTTEAKKEGIETEIKPEEVVEDYELSQDKQADAEYDIAQSVGIKPTKNYGVKGNDIIRVKGHTPDWANFSMDLNENPNIKRVINVTVGDYNNTDARRDKTTLEQIKKEHPNVEFIDIKVEDGESIKSAIERINKTIKPEEYAKKTGEEVKIPSQEEKGLQGRSLAYEVGEIEAELSYDFTKETKKEVKAKYDKAKGRLNEVINQNRSVLDEIDPRYTKHIVEQVNRLRPENATRVIKNVQKILENAQLREKVKGAFESKKKLDDLRNKPEWTQFIKGLDMKTRMGKKGKELSVRLNRIPVEKLPDTIIDDYIAVVNNLSSDKPDLGKVENFMNTYEAEIRKQEDLANIVVRDDKKAIERITMDAERLRLGMMVADATPEDIMTLKRQLGTLLGQARKMQRMGMYENVKTEEGFKPETWDTKIKELESFLEEMPKLTEEAQQKVKELEKQYKTTTIGEVSTRWNEMKKAFVVDGRNTYTESPDGKVVNEVISTLDKISKDDWAMERLKISEVDAIRDALDFIDYNKENPISSIELQTLAPRIEGVYQASRAKGAIFDVVEAQKDVIKINELLNLEEKDLAQKIGSRPDIHTGSLFNVSTRIESSTEFKNLPDFLEKVMNISGSMLNNPIHRIISHPSAEAINASEKTTQVYLDPINKVIAKYRQGWRRRNIYDYGKGRSDLKPFDRVNIAMAQVRIAQMMADPKGRVVQTGDKFYGVEFDGTPYKENGEVRMFDNAQEAIDYVKSKPVDKVGNRPLDFFSLVNYNEDGSYSETRKSAKIVNGSKLNKYELQLFEDAYNMLLERNKKNNPEAKDLSNIKTEEDALKLLEPNEVEMWNTLKEGYAKSKDNMSVIAAQEGIAIAFEKDYVPLLSRTPHDTEGERMSILDDIYSQSRKGEKFTVTGSILPKSKAMNYPDFNGLRAYERYVRDMAFSIHVMPEIRKMEVALGELVKEYKGKDVQLENLASAFRTNLIQSYQAEYTKRSMWGNVKFYNPITNNVFDVSKGLKMASQGVRNLLLNKALRIGADLPSNSIKLGDKSVKKLENKLEWGTFYAFNEGVMGANKNTRYGINKSGEYQAVENKGKLQNLADEWIGIPDDMSRSRWPLAFEDAFKKLSGEKFDVVKYANDWEYRDRVESMDAFKDSKAIADGYIEENQVPQNKFSNRKNVNLLMLNLSTQKRAYDYLNQMSTYSAQENMGMISYYNDWQFARMADVTPEAKSRGRFFMVKASQMLASNIAYNMTSQLVYNATLYGLGGDKAKQMAEDDLKNMFDPMNLVGVTAVSALNLMTSGYMNIGRAVMALAYNGGKSAVKLGADKPRKYRTDLAFKKMERAYFNNRLFDPTLDFTKRSVPWETAVNMIMPVIGTQLMGRAKDVGTLGEQTYNLLNRKDKYEGDEFMATELLRAVNALGLTYISPFASDINLALKSYNDEFYKSKLPLELFEADKIIHNFSLTNDEVEQIFSDEYNRVLELAKKNKEIYPEEEARNVASKKVQNYLSDVDNDALYKIYTYESGGFRNSEYIDGLYELMQDINADKSLRNEEKKAWNDKMAKEALKLQKIYDSYMKGESEDVVFIYDDALLEEYLNRKINEKVQNKLNLIEKKLIRYR